MFNANLRQFLTGKAPYGAYPSIYNPTTKDNLIIPEMLGIDRQSQLVQNASGQTLRLVR